MKKIQRDAGTMGIIAAVFLAMFVILLLTSGLDFQALNDPSRALPAFSQNAARWIATGIVGMLGPALAIIFTAGLYVRLREAAPTRAATVLLFGVLGSAGFVVNSLLLWLGGQHLAAGVAIDQVAANHAYVALASVNLAFAGLGNAFVGAALIIAGWAISATRALGAGLAWLAYVAGIVTLVLVFAPASSVVNLASFALIIIWLAWAGTELRR